MAIPHIIQMQQIKKRLLGLVGRPRIDEIRKIIDELPGYNTGPYGKIRQGLYDEIDKTKTKSNIQHQDWLGIKRQGTRQFMLVGGPSVGKSSLIKKLTGLNTKVAAYEFTTLKPIPGTININGAYFQIVDLPGLIEGASEDAGGGRRLIGLIKNTDGILLMHDLSKPLTELEKIINELNKAGITKPMLIIGNKIDLKNADKKLVELEKRFPDKTVLGISTITGKNLDELKQELWSMSKLIRVYTKNSNNGEPLILEENSSIKDFVNSIHKDLLKKFKHARIKGESAKFDNQIVGLSHILKDKDRVEIVTEI